MYQDSIQQICDPIKDLGEWVACTITQSERGAPLKMEKQERARSASASAGPYKSL